MLKLKIEQYVKAGKTIVSARNLILKTRMHKKTYLRNLFDRELSILIDHYSEKLTNKKEKAILKKLQTLSKKEKTDELVELYSEYLKFLYLRRTRDSEVKKYEILLEYTDLLYKNKKDVLIFEKRNPEDYLQVIETEVIDPRYLRTQNSLACLSKEL
jgi:hypothetical protein